MFLQVEKTYKMYINGAFVRGDSGYSEVVETPNKTKFTAVLGAKKDIKSATSAALSAFGGWQARTAFNRSQILYRIAEMLNGQKALFVALLNDWYQNEEKAVKEFETTVDRIVYYAGWCDKYQQVAASVNPVASSHFNFSFLEPVGVVLTVTDEHQPLLSMVSYLMPIIATGNTAIMLTPFNYSALAIELAHVIAVSDVPNGVVNILTGYEADMLSTAAEHQEINAIVVNKKHSQLSMLKEKSVTNLKRIYCFNNVDWFVSGQSLEHLTTCTELKTVWHPVDPIYAGKVSY